MSDSIFVRKLFTAAQVREFDQCAITAHGISGYELMQRAASAAVRLLRFRWPAAKSVSILCGPGNNGGDGFVMARQLYDLGYSVKTGLLGNVAQLQGDAKRAFDDFVSVGCECFELRACVETSADVIVDALFGSGLSRSIEGEAATLVAAANACGTPIVAVDVPSGLCSDSGAIMGAAICADSTMSFVAHKRGLFTGDGPDCSGSLFLADLDIPQEVFAGQNQSAIRVCDYRQVASLEHRPNNFHKGRCGNILVVGGNNGYAGAPHLAGRACLRSGAGKVTVACHPSSVGALTGTPELMTRGIENPLELDNREQRYDIVAIGPGLGQDRWAMKSLTTILDWDIPLVLDADALNLLVKFPEAKLPDCCVLTPHPAEAARLLGSDTTVVQRDRFAAAAAVHKKFGAVTLLKGNGTVVHSDKGVAVIDAGNSAMASAGMGDVLTGVIAALLGQGMPASDAAVFGAILHAQSGDRASSRTGVGLTALDVIESLGELLACPV